MTTTRAPRPKCHRWGRRHVGEPPVWTCSSCGLHARLRGAQWYLVWLDLYNAAPDTLRRPAHEWLILRIAAWTTARPPCRRQLLDFPTSIAQ